MKRSRVAAVVCLTSIALSCGCAKREADPFAPDEMLHARTRLPTEPQSPVDQGGAIPYDNPQAEPPDRPNEPAVDPAAGRGVPRSLTPPQTTQPAPPLDGSSRSTTRASDSGYQTLGAVVARVNNNSIYAEQVLAAAEPKLAKLARELDEPTFRRAAHKEIREQIVSAIQDELRHSAAERLLTPEEVQRAKEITANWRTRQINAAGGSLQAARDRAAQRGQDFDEVVQQQYRVILWETYRALKITPRVQVTAADMRRYYDRHRVDQFTVNDAAQFELIKIDPAKVGSVESARAKAEEIRARAAAGEDFAKLAEFSHGPRLRAADGSLTWFQRGAFALDQVEAAVWKLEPGQVTPVVEQGGAFYVARLEQKRAGHVMPFEDAGVQDRIDAVLKEQQLRALQDQLIQELQEGAVIRGDPRRDAAMMQPAVELAMQRYPRWASAK